MNNFNVVIAPQNWTFHNKFIDGRFRSVGCNSPSKLDLPQQVLSHPKNRHCCNSPSKLDLPQHGILTVLVPHSCNSPSKLDLPQPTIDNILIINVFN